jgi:hypothetical protein
LCKASERWILTESSLWIGGDPAELQVYGYALWSARNGIVMLRNPDVQPREFALDVAAAFELPFGAQTKYLLKSPWAEDRSKPALRAEAGKRLRVTLKPFEIVVLDVARLPTSRATANGRCVAGRPGICL